MKTKVLFLALILVAPFSYAVDEINTGFWGNTAIKGYDPVAYFTENRAVKGSKDFQHSWKGANWRFSSRQNLELFKASPNMYAPQYGGYCAWAVAQNDTAGIDPDQFTVLNGKLYLNYNKSINDKWTKDRDRYIIDADKHWPGLVD
ncbi:YHS domain-containing (seleno)protein [Porticoccus sp. W117]|uniref:YHS domain-containing (seleno)protein n=1 Tax=Porticoccus sp. W117 TaxID=3054777 RepID=UPI0025995198|nr:YHS domain-containing (seleno)protein [Porticoccus sp. W117]MDM3869989.1 YHS domain-containing (seleno)protein [Porticoccus sp. W117]